MCCISGFLSKRRLGRCKGKFGSLLFGAGIMHLDVERSNLKDIWYGVSGRGLVVES